MGVSMLGTYMLRIDSSSWWIVLFINVKWPLLSLLIDFSLKFTLSNEYNYSCLFMGSLGKRFSTLWLWASVYFFSVIWVSCKQCMVGSSFLIQFAILYLFIGALRPFTFSVGIERWLLFLVTFVSLLFSFTYFLFNGLLAQKGLFFLESTCLTQVSSAVCKSPLSILCSAGLVVTNSFIFFLLWKVFFLLQLGRIVLHVEWSRLTVVFFQGLDSAFPVIFLHLECELRNLLLF
jgi:hypothetical protein